MLYEYDVGKHPAEGILETFWEMNEHPEKVQEFANELFKGSVGRLKEIDKTIQLHTNAARVGHSRNTPSWAASPAPAGARNPTRTLLTLERPRAVTSSVTWPPGLASRRGFSILGALPCIGGPPW